MPRNDIPLEAAMAAVTKATRKKADPESVSSRKVSELIGYRKIKAHAKELERENLSRLIVFPSEVPSAEKKDHRIWYKLGNFSALCYAYELAPRMGKKDVKIFPDKDENVGRMQYIVSINSLDLLKSRMEKLGYKDLKEYKDGIVAFDLKHKYTEQDIDIWKSVEKQKQARINEVILPKNAIPAIGGGLINLMQRCLPRLKKLEARYFEVAGKQMGTDIVDMMAVYHTYADGMISAEEAGKKLYYYCNHLLASLEALRETKAFTSTACLDLGIEIANLKDVVVRKCLNTTTTKTK
ncbi:hypothetical protein IJI69_04910 [Candidatus Saccharibacteria bacterium]|nr:hypothetical protein [Candidatus Saccharibacteria bacterium]